MLYPKNAQLSLTDELFATPTAEYRGTPFWAWNCKIQEDEALRQIECFKEMGLGGFHIHSRTGLDTPYLGEEFQHAVRRCCEKAEQEQMLCWLYDEDRWPSGAAGGYVTKNPAFRARKLLFSPRKETLRSEEEGGPVRLLGQYAVRLENGVLAHYRMLDDGESAQSDEAEWFAYLEVNANHDPWYNDFTYADTLSKPAIDEFIRQTHEKYYALLGDRFSKSVPAIFTDEPQFNHKETLWHAGERRAVRIPYTDDLEETYRAAYGESLLEHLPELFWELPDGAPSLTRYRYHDHTAERFAQAFADNIGAWCEAHNLMLTGHMMEEPTLHSQTAVLGDTMRSYRGFQLPGIDMLCDSREYTTAKQAQSAAHQYGRPGVLSELYGVTNWDFDFRGHKLQGDWQAALGVTVRVPHLAWMSMAGEAKRDYPASISFQSPWYRDYRFIEDHFARVNTAMTRGKPEVHIGVIHPVESFWLHYGPNEQTAQIRDEMERHFSDLTQWLLFGLMDFDFICESLLPGQCKTLPDSAQFPVGEMRYDAVVVPDCETIRSTTLARLSAFAAHGGRVIFAGQIPKYVDAAPSGAARELAARCTCVPFTRGAVLGALDTLRQLDLRDPMGCRPDKYLAQLRRDGDNRWLFLANGRPVEKPDICWPEPLEIRVRGRFDAVVYDTMTGEIRPAAFRHADGNTIISHTFHAHDSLLVRLAPASEEQAASASVPVRPAPVYTARAQSPVPVMLHEPNVLLLDQAEYRIDDGPWQPREEILRIDNALRARLGFPPRQAAVVQPWTVSEPEDAGQHTLTLRFRVQSETAVAEPYLALENAAHTRITVNGAPITCTPDGWFTDPCIQKVKLPTLAAGETVLELSIDFGRKTDVEWCYLLCDFGVTLAGDTAKLTAPVKQLAFGDWTRQGLPFYAGNLTYRIEAELPAGRAVLRASRYRGAALKASLDGGESRVFAFAPYELDLGEVEAGRHTVELTVLGSRVNAFGQVHNADEGYSWYGPDSWRTMGDEWSYEYRMWPMGVLKAPEFEVYPK